jgi:hypothetical protein
MSLKTPGKLALALILGLGLAGCIDARVDVALTGPDTARASMVQDMGADFYAMVKMSAENGEASGESFCAEGELTENADGSATCTLVEEGPFAQLAATQGEDALRFEPAGAGLVRVSLPTAEMKAELGAGDDMDEQTRQMVEAFFAGHSVIVRFSGAEVVDTNMNLADDRRSAETEIAFLDLINGTANLPDEIYAVVRAP